MKSLIGILFVILFYVACGPPRHDDLYLRSIDKDYQGVIVEKGRDDKNWGIHFLKLENGKNAFSTNNFLCTYELWLAAEIGDSLSKVPGSLEYQLFKDDTILYFYPDCVEDKDIGITKNPEWEGLRR
ncbi:MAG: hypothetical protein AAFR66_22195 [Bacteroidota bacterium]